MTASLQLCQQPSHLSEEGTGWVTARGYNSYVLGGCPNLVPTAMIKTMTKRATRGGKGFCQPTVIRRRSQGMGARQELEGRNGSRDCRGGTLLTDLLSLLPLTTQDHCSGVASAPFRIHHESGRCPHRLGANLKETPSHLRLSFPEHARLCPVDRKSGGTEV